MKKPIVSTLKAAAIALSIGTVSISGTAQAHDRYADLLPYYFFFSQLDDRPAHHRHSHKKHAHNHRYDRYVKQHRKHRKSHSHDHYSDHRPQRVKHHKRDHRDKDHYKRDHNKRDHRHQDGKRLIKKHRYDD